MTQFVRQVEAEALRRLLSVQQDDWHCAVSERERVDRLTRPAGGVDLGALRLEAPHQVLDRRNTETPGTTERFGGLLRSNLVV
ncbi:hypothetical protein [Agromyces sp. NPDC055661]